MIRALRPAVLAVAIALSAAPALADEAPSAEDRTRIEAALRQLGFTAWGEIEREDDDTFEVDDARMPDGTKFDLKLAAADLRVIEQERD
jgi:hypothetical protein